MLINGTRKLAAVFALASVLTLGATPALALQDEGMRAREKSVPVVIDALIMRPLGLMLTAGGAVFSVVPTMITLLTRPTDVMKPLNELVATPFRYTFLDPLGEHPPIRND